MSNNKMTNKKKPAALLVKKSLAASTAVAATAFATATSASAEATGTMFNGINQPTAKANITVCHKGRDLQVSVAGVVGHMMHGDSLGSCGGDTGGRGI